MAQFNIYMNRSTEEYFREIALEGESIPKCIARKCRELAASRPVIDVETINLNTIVREGK